MKPKAPARRQAATGAEREATAIAADVVGVGDTRTQGLGEGGKQKGPIERKKATRVDTRRHAAGKSMLGEMSGLKGISAHRSVAPPPAFRYSSLAACSAAAMPITCNTTCGTLFNVSNAHRCVLGVEYKSK
jgi:hypothetical protein